MIPQSQIFENRAKTELDAAVAALPPAVPAPGAGVGFGVGGAAPPNPFGGAGMGAMPGMGDMPGMGGMPGIGDMAGMMQLMQSNPVRLE